LDGIITVEDAPVDGDFDPVEGLGLNAIVRVPVSEATYNSLLQHYSSMVGDRSDYSVFGRTCNDFTQSVYENLGLQGHFGSLFPSGLDPYAAVWWQIPTGVPAQEWMDRVAMGEAGWFEPTPIFIVILSVPLRLYPVVPTRLSLEKTRLTMMMG
jgi:hypothetical protein